MANLEIAGAHKRTQKGNVDYYYGGENEAWADIAAAKAGVPPSIRPGKTVGVYISGEIVEYWWPDATHIADGDLITKTVPLPQGLATTDSPTFAGMTLTGLNPLVVTKTTSTSDAPIIGKQANIPDNHSIFIAEWWVTNTGGSYHRYLITGASLPTGSTSVVDAITWPGSGGSRDIALMSNITDAIAAITSPFKGHYGSLSALQTAHATSSDGDYAFVESSGVAPVEYIWDTVNASWGPTGSVGAGAFGTLTGVPADNSALASALGNKVDKVAGKMLSTEDYTTAEKSKLSGIAAGATANDTDANLKARANHTGSQLASTISDFLSSVQGSLLTGLSLITSSAISATDTLLAALGKLQTQITANSSSITTNTSNISTNTSNITANTSAITSEASTRASADTTLQNNINTNTSAITANAGAIAAETTTRASADTTLQNNINTNTSVIVTNTTNITTNAIAIATETTNRVSADTTLQNNINTNTSAIATNTSNISLNAENIIAEASSRAVADTALQASITSNTSNIAANTAAIALKDNSAIGFNDQSGTAYTAVLADASQKIRMSNSAANVVTIPTNAVAAFPIGSYFYVSMNGTGQTSIVGAAGVTLQGATTLIDVQYNEALVWKEATNTWKVIGILPDVSAIDTADAYIKRPSGGNTINYKAKVLQTGGVGNGLKMTTGTSQYFQGSDAGLPSGNPTAFSVSCWVRLANSSYGYGDNITLISYGTPSGNHSLYVTANTTASSPAVYIGNGGAGSSIALGTTGILVGSWAHVVVTVSSGTCKAYVNGVNTGTGSLTFNITLSGILNNIGGGVYTSSGSFDQLLVYNAVLSASDVTALYAAGSGTANIPQSANCIRRYEFEDGVGSTITDTNTAGTQYNLTAFNSPTWLGAGNAIVPVASTTVIADYLTIRNGVNASERGQGELGNFLMGLRLIGRTIKHLLNTNGSISYIAWYQNNLGKVLHNPTNVTEEPTVASTYDLAGNMTIGAAYAGTNAAPANGLLVQGRHLSGTTTDNLTDQQQISGHLALVTAGNKLKIATGTNASIGAATLVAGTVTVSTTAVATGSQIMYCRKTIGGTVGNMSIGTIVNSTSFVLNSDNASDTSVINWWIIN
jgi:hypothetical protein